MWSRFVLPICLAASVLGGCAREQNPSSHSWKPAAAAAYLDQREVAWMNWPGAARDHGTFCISCHTNVPYALAMPALRSVLAQQVPTAEEQELLADVSKRVRLWKETKPYYADRVYGKSGEADRSRGTEAVLNAFILANHDAEQGHLSDLTRMAFEEMWEEQETQGQGAGSWDWLQFGMEPWEAKDSQYYGAALAALAVGIAPDNYRSSPDIQDKLHTLSEYLNREYPTQSTINRVVLLWASTKIPGLLSPERHKAIIQEVLDTQQSDGGWELSALSWPGGWGLHSLVRRWLRSDGTTQHRQSDGYATGLIVYVLPQAGVSRNDADLKKGVAWLEQHENPTDGSWPSWSLTEHRNPASIVGHFMRDAATAYAVLGLYENGVHRQPISDPYISGRRQVQAYPQSAKSTNSLEP
jgi:squalene-hopene/tetraprenyl-beta-curcumene cyclase